MTKYDFFINIILTIYLLICTRSDIKTYTVSFRFSAIVALILIIIRIISNMSDLPDILLSLLPGIILLAIGLITRQSVGYGDGIIFMTTGAGIGSGYIVLLVFISFVLSSFYALFLISKKQSGKTAIPFVPFILSGFILVNLIKIL